MDLLSPALNRLLDSFLDEDLGRGDLTSIALQDCSGHAYLLSKQAGIFCGGQLIQRLFRRLDERVKINCLVAEGDRIIPGQRLIELDGPATSLVAGERTALNLSMRLSGIATATAALVAELQGTSVKLADTRKTTPGLRIFEKYAVRCGGGINHRLGLDDAAMLKENHIEWAGGITAAVRAIKQSAPWPSRVIVEAETFDQAEEAIKAGADGLLLDEFAPDKLKKIVPTLRELASLTSARKGLGTIILEASGVDPKEIKLVALTGVDFISTSSPVTRSSWLDFSMRFTRLDS